MVLTKRQKEFLDYIRSYLEKNGYAPTLEEIGEHFQLTSPATVHKHLTNLEKKGLIRRTWNHSRAIELVSGPERVGAVELPLLGEVAAGAPIEAIEQDDTVAVPDSFVRRGHTFVLRVVGDSMIEDGILDGDFIVVEERPNADDGETVVAIVGGEATVKKLYREADGIIRLQPSNARLKPLRVAADDLEIRGAVVAVMRKY